MTPIAPLSNAEDNTGKLMTKRIQSRDRTTLILTYSTSDANALRAMTQTLRLKGDRKASLSLLARRAMARYLAHVELLQSRPALFACEVAELERMCTPVPKPAKKKPA